MLSEKRLFRVNENICAPGTLIKCTGRILCGLKDDGSAICSDKPTCSDSSCKIDLCGSPLVIPLVAGPKGPSGPPGIVKEIPNVGSWVFSGCMATTPKSCGEVIADACYIGSTCGYADVCEPGVALTYRCEKEK